MYFIVVDTYNKWREVYEMISSTTSKTIEIFAAYGLPDQLVSDNGPRFSSVHQLFLKCNSIKYCGMALYHLPTNSAGERIVQTLKKSIMAGWRHKRSGQHN